MRLRKRHLVVLENGVSFFAKVFAILYMVAYLAILVVSYISIGPEKRQHVSEIVVLVILAAVVAVILMRTVSYSILMLRKGWRKLKEWVPE